MTQDVLGAIWFIGLLIVAYGLATGHLCFRQRETVALRFEERDGA